MFLFQDFKTNSEAASRCIGDPLRSTVGQTVLTFIFPDVLVSGEESRLSDNRLHERTEGKEIKNRE